MDLSGYTFGKICTGEINLSECQAAQFYYLVLFALGVIQVIASVRFLMRSVTDAGTCAPLLLFDILCATYRQHIKAKCWPHWCFIIIRIATAQELKIDRSRFRVFMPLFTLLCCIFNHEEIAPACCQALAFFFFFFERTAPSTLLCSLSPCCIYFRAFFVKEPCLYVYKCDVYL